LSSLVKCIVPVSLTEFSITIGWNYTDSDLALVQQYYEVKATKPDVVRNDTIFFYVASELQKCAIHMSMLEVKKRFTDL